MDRQKLIGVACAALAILLLTLAAFSHSWITGRSFDIESKVGLRAVDICTEGAPCEQVSLKEWGESSFAPKGLSTYRVLGGISFWLALATAFALLLSAGFALRGSVPDLPMHPASAALLLTIALLIVGVLTLALHPFKQAGWGTGPGFLLLAGGDVLALAAALLLGRSGPFPEDEWFD